MDEFDPRWLRKAIDLVISFPNAKLEPHLQLFRTHTDPEDRKFITRTLCESVARKRSLELWTLAKAYRFPPNLEYLPTHWLVPCGDRTTLWIARANKTWDARMITIVENIFRADIAKHGEAAEIWEHVVATWNHEQELAQMYLYAKPFHRKPMTQLKLRSRPAWMLHLSLESLEDLTWLRYLYANDCIVTIDNEPWIEYCRKNPKRYARQLTNHATLHLRDAMDVDRSTAIRQRLQLWFDEYQHRPKKSVRFVDDE